MNNRFQGGHFGGRLSHDRIVASIVLLLFLSFPLIFLALDDVTFKASFIYLALVGVSIAILGLSLSERKIVSIPLFSSQPLIDVAFGIIGVSAMFLFSSVLPLTLVASTIIFPSSFTFWVFAFTALFLSVVYSAYFAPIVEDYSFQLARVNLEHLFDKTPLSPTFDMGAWLAIAIVAAMFPAFHYIAWGVSYWTAFGMAALLVVINSILCKVRGSAGPGVVSHWIWNGYVIITTAAFNLAALSTMEIIFLAAITVLFIGLVSKWRHIR